MDMASKNLHASHFFDPIHTGKENLVQFLAELGDKQLMENATQAADWRLMKKIANGELTFKLKPGMDMSDILSDEGVDKMN